MSSILTKGLQMFTWTAKVRESSNGREKSLTMDLALQAPGWVQVFQFKVLYEYSIPLNCNQNGKEYEEEYICIYIN